MKLLPVFAAALVPAIPLMGIADSSIVTDLVNPPGSGFTVSKTVENPVSEIDFAGQTWVSGTLRAQWSPSVDGAEPFHVLSTNIQLDKGEVERLPHLGHDKFSSIDINNAEEAVQLAFDKRFAAQVLGKQVQLAKIRGRFLIKDLALGECGSPWASASLVTAKGQQSPVIGHGLEFGDC